MDTLDNANTTTNPFANSNNPDILAQKEGFVLNLADGFKQNGTEKSPTNDFLGRPTNGKRSADEFDDDDDLGPETDVDAIDDVLLSPAIAAAKSLAEGIVNNNPTNMFDPFGDKEEKATLETDSELQKQQTSEFDLVKSPREETPTPPADSVHDASGLVDNVAESGEDSDDEWNYFKGDTAQKENIPPSQTDKEVCELTQSDLDSDTMSQLNPNAAEFVPVSPKRNTASPAYQTLIDDSVIAQSPRRVTSNDIDISVPNPQEFESEIKSRPSEIKECANGDDSEEEEHKLTSQEIMENLLNGKSIEEIEFQPNSTPTKTYKADEFHFGPNATPFSTPAKLLDQSEALSTKAVFGDESTASYLEGKGFDDSCFAGSDINESQAFAKEDPMSMSFYQDKDDETNPFDLNKVQVLPENIDDFLEKQEESNSLLNDTISDLPEHNPNEFEKINNEINEVAGAIIKETAETITSEAKSPFDDNLLVADNIMPSQSPLPTSQSPVPVSQSPLPLSKSPAPEAQSPLSGVHSPISGEQIPLSPTQSPLPAAHSPSPICPPRSPYSPLPDVDAPLRPGSASPFPAADSPVPTMQSPVPPQPQSPVPTSKSPLIQAQSPIPPAECLLPSSQSPLPGSPSPIPPAQSPLPTSQSPVPAPQSPLLTSKSPIPPSESPLPTSQSPLPTSQSPLPTLKSPIPPSQSPLPISQSPILSQNPFEVAHSPVRSPQPPAESPLPISQSPLPPQSPLHELESPVEDVTSSVKDSPVLAESPIEKLMDSMPKQTIEQTIGDLLATNNVEKPFEEELMPEMCSVSTPKSIDTESVATTDVNSFLERSSVPEVASPLSPSGDENKLIDALTSELETHNIETTTFTASNLVFTEHLSSDVSIPQGSIDVDIKSEIIAPEFPVQTITTPSEESKTEDIIQIGAPLVELAAPEIKENVTEAAVVATAAAAVTAVTAAAVATQKKAPAAKPKAGTPTAAKKTAAKSATSPTKTTPGKLAAAKPLASKTTTTTTSRVSQTKTATTPTAPKTAAAKPSPKPKTTTTTTAAKTAEKKPLTNGDVKPAVAKRTSITAASKTATTKPVPSKLSPSKTDSKAPTGTARPATAPAKTTTALRQSTTTRPTSLTKTSTTRTVSSTVTATKSTLVKTTTLTSPKTTTSAAPKPRPTTAPARSKPPTSRPTPKAPDTEKQIKETANKQITASRTTTTTSRTLGSAGKTTTTTVRKTTEVKAPGTRTTLTKTTTSGMKTTDVKKPAELIRHPNKTKPSVTKKTKVEQNGIAAEVNTITFTPTNIEPQLIKDVSPVIENRVLDNSQISEINNVTD